MQSQDDLTHLTTDQLRKRREVFVQAALQRMNYAGYAPSVTDPTLKGYDAEIQRIDREIVSRFGKADTA